MSLCLSSGQDSIQQHLTIPRLDTVADIKEVRETANFKEAASCLWESDRRCVTDCFIVQILRQGEQC
jgi:hypothetical protein